jgi:hypothetical protein
VAISIVNGYFCNDSCDAAKARAGQDPHPRSPTNQTPNAKPDSKPGSAETPAVTYGGSLTGTNAVAAVAAGASGGATGGYPPPTVDIQA